MSHISLFNEACTIIFTRLYESFPIPIDFDQREIGFYDPWDISEGANLRRQVLHETLVLLRAEGFISFEFYSPGGTIGVTVARLTTKGLTKLQRVPEGMKTDSKPLIDQLTDAASSISAKSSAAAVSETIKRVLVLVFS